MTTVTTHGPDGTRALGLSIAQLARPGDVVLLVGGLGAGKTTFVQGLAAGLGYEGDVTSPTFTIRHTYAGRVLLVHADLWRLETHSELLDLSLDEDLEEGAVVVAEWGEAAEGLFSAAALVVTFEVPDEAGAEQERRITIEGRGPAWAARAGAVEAAAAGAAP